MLTFYLSLISHFYTILAIKFKNLEAKPVDKSVDNLPFSVDKSAKPVDKLSTGKKVIHRAPRLIHRNPRLIHRLIHRKTHIKSMKKK